VAAPGAASAGGPAGASGRKVLRIAMIGKSSTNPVFLSARTGAEIRARELSATRGTPVEIVWLTPPGEDGDVQAQRVRQAVNEGVDAVLISCSDAAKVTRAIDDAVAHGVPVMTFDSDAPGSRRFSYVGVDDFETGRTLMSELARLMNERGKVAVLAGNKDAPNLRKRLEGLRREAARHPGVKIVETYFHVETPQDASAEVLRATRAHPEVVGWAMVGGWALYTKTLLSELAPGRYIIVSVDALPPTLIYVEKGLVPVLLAQPSYLWGTVGVETIVDKLLLKKEPPPVIPMELLKVTKENFGAWARQLKGWGFADVPEQYLELK
jgi:ribose transport system substrate-binding protein